MNGFFDGIGKRMQRDFGFGYGMVFWKGFWFFGFGHDFGFLENFK
mgnify:CR=1